jgi:Tfp pilus assembly protein PilO
MNKYFSQLRPLERRLVVGVGVMVVLVLNWMFVWPHFSDYSNYQNRLDRATIKLNSYQRAVAQLPELKRQLEQYESHGESVPLEDQSMNFMRTIQTQSAQCGVQLQTFSRPVTQTNDLFFVEQVQNINVIGTEEQLVDFLYKLGSGGSMIRVRDLSLQPDAPRQRLIAEIRLVASYQKNLTSSPAGKNATAMAK